jgi:membrane-bound lytic murein transglycosylase B
MTARATAAVALVGVLLACGPTGARRADSAVPADQPATVLLGSDVEALDVPSTSARHAEVAVRAADRQPARAARHRRTVVRAAAAPAVAGNTVYGPEGTVGELGIPMLVLQAYHRAADRLAAGQTACHLPWWLLAGIGHTESGHAEGGRLTADGTTRGRIVGPRLDGHLADNAVISDTDKGRLDGDPVYDRAVGPMQFIPSTWARWGLDGNADGKADPSNIFDATLAAGEYLCADSRNLTTPAGLRAAVLSYNQSEPYLATVLAWGRAYQHKAVAIAASKLPVVGDVTRVRPPRTGRPGAAKHLKPIARKPVTPPTHPIAPPIQPVGPPSSPAPPTSGPPTSSVPAPPGSSGPCSPPTTSPAPTTPGPTTAGTPAGAPSSGEAPGVSASVATASSAPASSSSSSAPAPGPSCP